MNEILTKPQQDQLAREKLMGSYQRVLGVPPPPGVADSRTPDQIAVWADLEIAGYFKQPTHVPHPTYVGDRHGEISTLRAELAEGRRTLFLYMLANVEFRPVIQQQTK